MCFSVLSVTWVEEVDKDTSLGGSCITFDTDLGVVGIGVLSGCPLPIRCRPMPKLRAELRIGGRLVT
ncbi:hypothetical protein GOSPT_131_00220 [Gordonia sputi NBRC 100414]|uniref:Uncharacterized protein n=1 Tax=Gordonia sputi NBRC 100414 TaxID=1089453 RepID=H5U6X9_9ACTN|nr:hypothetical protein A5766_07955 [Gordonia sp. 852002-51296_SCH5728562-b]GAB41487.1 hypothetical protein GOSPT_131_00220 [Gordonia sputi NBRC 100414]